MSRYSGEIKLDYDKHDAVDFGANWLEITLTYWQEREYVEEGKYEPESNDVTDEGIDIDSVMLHYADEDGVEWEWPIDYDRLPDDRKAKIADHINRIANKGALDDELTEEEES